jgi:carbohydrate diacid regulator
MAAELVLEQSFLLERVQLKQRLQSEIVNQLISDEHINEVWIKERAGFLGIDLLQPRAVIVLKHSGKQEITNLKLISAIQFELGKQDLTGVTFNDEIVILKAGSQSELKVFLNRLVKVIKKKNHIGSGSLAESIKEMKTSFQQAQSVLMLGQKLEPDADFYLYKDYRLEVTLSKLAQTEQADNAFSFYDRLLEQDKKGELAHTLDIYIKEGGELNKIAESLFIHRNTLRYRLDKIMELTGKDPRNIKNLMELYIAKILNDLY